MTDEFEGVMDRQPTLQTITWLLNLRKFGQLDLNPPYQRRSVWSLREKQRFVDTIMRNYPSPAIFLHVTYDDDGNVMHHVVDGKQRLSAILDFVDSKIKIAKDFGDKRLDGKSWKQLEEYPRMRKAFWTYQLTVEQIDDVNEPLVREVFERLNRNSRKLEPQEMRHARYDGWLISYLETHAGSQVWKDLKVSTRARTKRMTDVQMLSEFVQVLVEDGPVGFDQEALDQLYADYDEPEAAELPLEQDELVARFEAVSLTLRDMQLANGVVADVASSRNHLYSLWAYLAMYSDSLAPAKEIAERYRAFIGEFNRIRQAEREDPNRSNDQDDERIRSYIRNSTGATTEAPQRLARHRALAAYMEDRLIE